MTTASTHSSAHKISARSRSGNTGRPAPLSFAVQSDDQRIAQRASLLQAADVPGMQQIKAAVGENNAAAVAFLASKPQNRFFESQYLRVQRNSMQAGANLALVSHKNLVYHARQGPRP
jgi:hypothetical protein